MCHILLDCITYYIVSHIIILCYRTANREHLVGDKHTLCTYTFHRAAAVLKK